MLLKKCFLVIASFYYKFVNIINLKINKVKDVSNFKVNGIMYIKNIGEISIGDGFVGNSGNRSNPIGGDTKLNLVTHNKDAKIIIGRNVGMSNATLYAWNEIRIGNNVLIGGGVRIWDSNFHSLNPHMRTSGQDTDVKIAKIDIHDNVFIGGGSIILKGVTIGENTVIAAGSVVTKSIPANCIAGGNPCLVIKKINFEGN